MAQIRATEVDLLTFFEVDPVQLDPGVPWVYNESTYEVSSEGLSLSFVIEPASAEVRVSLMCRDRLIYELNARQIEDVIFRREGAGDTLSILIGASDELVLRVRPNITIHQAYART